jgi:hypothetical protein
MKFNRHGAILGHLEHFSRFHLAQNYTQTLVGSTIECRTTQRQMTERRMTGDRILQRRTTRDRCCKR